MKSAGIRAMGDPPAIEGAERTRSQRPAARPRSGVPLGDTYFFAPPRLGTRTFSRKKYVSPRSKPGPGGVTVTSDSHFFQIEAVRLDPVESEPPNRPGA